jgi:LRR receptor-like serine/threonine-protein kinase FLS2
MVVHIVAGVIPSEIDNLQYLKLLDTRFNNFTVPNPFEIFNISTIIEIDMSYNNLSGHLPSNVSLFFPNLYGLYLEGNKLSGTIPSSISNASQLTKLDLGDNSFWGLIPKSLDNLRLLEWLTLSVNNFGILYRGLEIGNINEGPTRSFVPET